MQFNNGSHAGFPWGHPRGALASQLVGQVRDQCLTAYPLSLSHAGSVLQLVSSTGAPDTHGQTMRMCHEEKMQQLHSRHMHPGRSRLPHQAHTSVMI